MVTTKHFCQRMHQRGISPYMVELILRIGEFNNNCQRLIIDDHQKDLLDELKIKTKEESLSVTSTSKLLCKRYKNNELSKQDLISERRELKKVLKELRKNQKDLEKLSTKKHTLVLENNSLITVF